MVTRTGGARRKTRQLFAKKPRTKGKISIRNALQLFEKGDKVLLKAEPAIQHGMYFRRFHARPGEIVGQQGACYLVRIHDGKRTKDLIIHPIHLRKL